MSILNDDYKRNIDIFAPQPIFVSNVMVSGKMTNLMMSIKDIRNALVAGSGIAANIAKKKVLLNLQNYNIDDATLIGQRPIVVPTKPEVKHEEKKEEVKVEEKKEEVKVEEKKSDPVEKKVETASKEKSSTESNKHFKQNKKSQKN